MSSRFEQQLHRVSFAFNILLAILCAFLIHQNRELKSAGGPAPGMAALKPGERVAGFAYRTLDGETLRLEYTEPRAQHLLFVISTTCPYCQKSLPNIQQLFDRHGDGGSRLLAVSIHDLVLTARFAAERKLGFPVVSAPDEEFSRSYKIAVVPTIILLNGDGVVQKVWEGELTDILLREVETSLARASVAPV